MSEPGFILRFKRAHEHLTTLDTNIGKFLANHPYQPIGQFNSQTRQYRLGFRIEREPPPDWGLLIGECLYNLRSSLDHLVWQLACDFSGDGDSKTQFPIFLKWDRFWGVSKRGTPTERSGLRKMCLLDPAAQAVIDGLQPYYRPSGPPNHHPLWLLQELRNEDEHRMLHVVGAAMGDSEFVLRDQTGRSLFTATYASGNAAFLPFDEQAHFMSGLIQGRGVTEVHVDGDFTFEVAFDPRGPTGGQPVRYILSDIASFISGQIFPALTLFIKK